MTDPDVRTIIYDQKTDCGSLTSSHSHFPCLYFIDGFSGLGTFNHAVVTSLGNTSGTILRSIGHALKDTSESATFHFFIVFLVT